MNDTSDDFLTGGGDIGSDIIPARTAEPAKRTATAVDQTSEQAKRNRKRRAAGGGRGLGPPQLGIPGLLGVSG